MIESMNGNPVSSKKHGKTSTFEKAHRVATALFSSSELHGDAKYSW